MPTAPRLIDLLHLGHERVIGSWLLDGVLLDPGPASCLPVLLEALGGQPPRAIALTHIHLDHAGATGSLLERFPETEVWVHERGAPHLLDPARLLASAGRLYGDRLEALYGEVLPVPGKRLRVLSGGERVGAFEVAYTPGHASHHVCYLYEPLRWAFAGDLAGVRLDVNGPVLAPTPPPDIDLEAWRDSLDLIEGWRPEALVPTHFGRYSDVGEHFARIRASLDALEARARSLSEDEFIAALRADMASAEDTVLAQGYEQGLAPDQTYRGLERYLRKAA